jgi:hypothetical protein
MINPDDITNAYKVLQPYWRSYRGGIWWNFIGKR